ncbi:MAG: aspartyl protease family protein [Marinilabiliales bacterium]|nr:aspartyl protease family protein [Marinilabiliales bacterium]
MNRVQSKWLLIFLPLLWWLPSAEKGDEWLFAAGIPSQNEIPVRQYLTDAESYSYSPENLNDRDSVIIPLKRAGRLFLIEAKAEGESGNLVFDTGASGLVFNSTYFRNRVKNSGSTANGATGNLGGVEKVTIGNLGFAGLSFDKLQADLVPLGHIENRRGVRILGLIGFNLLKDFEIVLDASQNQLKLYRLKPNGERVNRESPAFHSDHVQKMICRNNILFLNGTIGNKHLTFCFDTGAETNVINSYLSRNVLSTITLSRRSILKGAGQSTSEVLYGRMNDFSIGNTRIEGMETILSSLDALSEAYGTHIDGMLGFNFIEKGVLCINFKKEEFGIQFRKGEAL